MIVGVPSEVKADEYRVAMLPVGAEELTAAGHTVLFERGAGQGSGIVDAQYSSVGATIVEAADEIWARADLVVKVKEPQAAELPKLRRGQTVFTYFHFAADLALTRAIIDSGITAIAYETLRDARGGLPLLTPMSEVAGRMSIQEGAKYLERPQEGRGILLAGVPGVAPAEVAILGGGIVGSNAAKVAAGLGANVTILDINVDRLRYLDDIMPPNVTTLYSDRHTILETIQRADLVIGAILITGARAPRLVRRADLALMKHGSVIVDVAIDQGGCVETSRPTTHQHPTYVEEGVVHYCVTNMPGAVGRTSTYALCNVTLPYVLQFATRGWRAVAATLPGVADGVNIDRGRVTNEAVASTFGLPFRPLDLTALAGSP
jgi:alanine dehydrogenase